MIFLTKTNVSLRWPVETQPNSSTTGNASVPWRISMMSLPMGCWGLKLSFIIIQVYIITDIEWYISVYSVILGNKSLFKVITLYYRRVERSCVYPDISGWIQHSLPQNCDYLPENHFSRPWVIISQSPTDRPHC